MTKLNDSALDQLFRKARSHNTWQNKPLDEAILQDIYALMKMAPTSANCSPARIVFVTSQAAKEKLLPLLLEQNQEKTRAAAACALIAYDTKFYDHIPHLFPHNPGARDWFSGNEALAEETAFRNSSLQGAYFMLAARALGVDVGPMSGFDAAGVNAQFFSDTSYKVNFICNIGYGDAAGLFARSPRLNFEDACSIL